MKTKSHHTPAYLIFFCVLMFIRICVGILENQRYYDAVAQRNLHVQYTHEEHLLK